MWNGPKEVEDMILVAEETTAVMSAVNVDTLPVTAVVCGEAEVVGIVVTHLRDMEAQAADEADLVAQFAVKVAAQFVVGVGVTLLFQGELEVEVEAFLHDPERLMRVPIDHLDQDPGLRHQDHLDQDPGLRNGTETGGTNDQHSL